MGDIPSGLPVRSEKDGLDERLHAKLVDYSAPDTAGNQLAIAEGRAQVSTDGTYNTVSNTNPANVGLIGHSRNASPTDADQVLRLTGKSSTSGDTRALDVAMHDGEGEAVNTQNPLPVSIISTRTGSEVLVAKQATGVAKAASDSHTYTITSGKALVLQKVSASASGKIKVEIKLGVIGAPVVKKVLFNSTANPNVEYGFSNPQELPDTAEVSVTITNLDNSPQDLYSTIEGYEV